MNTRFLLPLFSALMLTACSPGGHKEPIQSDPNTKLETLCEDLTLSRNTLTFCVEKGLTVDASAPLTFVYIFHGMGGNANWPFTEPAASVFSAAKTTQSGRTLVKIGVSMGTYGVIREQASEILAGAMPQIEQKLSGRIADNRVMVGASMGGHNIFRIAAENPASFKGLAALCPAVVTIDPFNTQEVQAYIDRNQSVINMNDFNGAMNVFRQTFQDSASFQRNNPYTFLMAGAYKDLPVLISIGDKDSLGFFEGAQAFLTVLQNQGNQQAVMTTVPNGDHCKFDGPSVVQFLLAR